MRFDAVAFLESLFQVPATIEGTTNASFKKELHPKDLPADWHFVWDERAAIMEYDGGLTREHAEVAALQDVLRQMRAAGIPLPNA